MKHHHKYKMTVIVPSYNNGIYLRQCLDSILNQTVNFKYQVIITDDHSQDDSIDIIKEYAAKFPDIIFPLYSSQNCMLFKNMLKALEKMEICRFLGRKSRLYNICYKLV